MLEKRLTSSCFRFLYARKASEAERDTRAATPTPTPMPALAPVERPELVAVELDPPPFVVAEALELENGFEPGEHPRKSGIVILTRLQSPELKSTAFF